MNPDENINEMIENPKSTLFKLAIPTFISLGCIYTNSFLDSIWVSGLGHIEVTAVGLSSPIFILLTLIGITIGTTVNISLSKAIAEKNVLESQSIIKNVIIVIIVLSVLIPLTVLPSLDIILNLIGVGVAYKASHDYLNILILFIGVIFIAETIPFLLRLQGYIKAPLYIIVVTSILNMILDPIFIYYFNLRIEGAAIATVISVTISCFLLIIMLIITKGKYVSVGEHTYDLKRDLNVLKQNLKIAIPILFQLISSLFFLVILNRFFVYEGLIYITAYSFVCKIFSLVSLPLNAFSSSMLSVIGFLIGAGKWDEIKPTFKYTFYIIEICTVIPCVIIFFGSDFISATLYQTNDLLVINQISLGLKFLSIFNIFGVGAFLVDSMFLSIEKQMRSFIIPFVGIVLDIIALCIMELHFHIYNSVYYVLLVGSLVQIPVYYFIFRKDLREYLNRKKFSNTNEELNPEGYNG
jgi:putative MATE family efflux protein